jgi:C_GCAxxG_C_C family probable redox protein
MKAIGGNPSWPESEWEDNKMSTSRRKFLGMGCSCLGLLSVLDLKAFPESSGGQDLSLADQTAKALNEGFWSADSLVMGTIRYLKKPEGYVSLATGFGGGIGRKDLCGFVTGGVMAIGLFAGTTKGNDKKGRQTCQRLTKEYLDWWAKSYPLHCADIKQPCDYRSMGAKASAFLQELFSKESAKS